MKYIFCKNTIMGKINISADNESILGVFLNNDFKKSDYEFKETKIISEAFEQLDEYLNGKITVFNLKLNLIGTNFQKNVWNALKNIEYGKVVSYKDIAEKIKNRKAYRAVALACKNNPLPIFIPCHRVIGSDGSLTGYAYGLDIKRKLLNLENVII